MIKVDPYPCLRELESADDNHDKPSAIDVLIRRVGLLLDHSHWRGNVN